jgi:signal peptidase II
VCSLREKSVVFSRPKEISIVSAKLARLYDAFAILMALLTIVLDQWTKSLIVRNLSPGNEVPFPLVGQYLILEYTQNNGAAFSIFQGSILLVLLISLAILVIATLYVRMLNSGPLVFKLIFGLIIGGAIGNLIDRFARGGYVIDFISFRIPEIGYRFAIFNVADAAISIGVILLLGLVLLTNFHRPTTSVQNTNQATTASTPQQKDLSEKQAEC